MQGTGNANFYFGINLLYAMLQVRFSSSLGFHSLFRCSEFKALILDMHKKSTIIHCQLTVCQDMRVRSDGSLSLPSTMKVMIHH